MVYCKIDQTQQKVVVRYIFPKNVTKYKLSGLLSVGLPLLTFSHSFSHSTHRTFGKQQWQQLYDSLSSWKANLATVKTSLQGLSPSA